ncbi:MAG: signal peptidase I [Oscillospiraceae bacterium]|nr:signal peptidase I [Oscillospiraceae bacterium]
MAKFQINYEVLDQDDNKRDGIPYEEFIEWIETIVFAFFAVILVFTFIVRQVTVDGRSMVPTLEDGDKLIVQHLMYTPARGDIVVIDSLGLGKPLIKRVIACGGDTIDIDFASGTVTVNGEVQQEDYIKDLTQLDEGGQTYPVTVPSGYYFVMGDNRMDSLDSRSSQVGLVSEDEIMGRAFFRLWPASGIGSVK